MMKRSFFKSFLLCLLCALLFCTPLTLASCGPNGPTPTPPEDDDTPQPAPDEPTVVLAGEGAENQYIVVRSENANSGSDISKGAALLCKTINERFGSDLSITTDWTGAGGVAESPYEILVGTTNRDVSPTVDKELGVNEFIIRMVDTKLVITASSQAGITYAVNYFIEKYVDAQTASLKVPATLNYKGEYTVYYEVASAGGSGAAKYDTALALACLQGIVNRESKSTVYVNSGG